LPQFTTGRFAPVVAVFRQRPDVGDEPLDRCRDGSGGGLLIDGRRDGRRRQHGVLVGGRCDERRHGLLAGGRCEGSDMFVTR